MRESSEPGQVSIEPIDQRNWRRTLDLAVRPDQQRFVADHAPIALVILAKSFVRPGGLRWRPFAICEGGSPVSLFALADGQPEEECWIYHFFIDHRAQGRGLGRAALDALLTLVEVECPAAERVMLTVHPENAPARALYEGRGFTSTGAHRDGEDVLALLLR